MSSVDPISWQTARRVLDAAVTMSQELHAEVGIAIVDPGGNLKGLARMDGASFLTTSLAMSKAITAAGTRMDTAAFAEFLAKDPVLLAGIASRPDLSVLPGGVPIAVNGEVTGAIGVSGAPGELEARIAQAGLAVI